MENNGFNTSKTLSVIILNYKNIDLTAKCVNYLLESAHKVEITLEIIVVDNSAPVSGNRLRKVLPVDVKIIGNQENLGFSRANNQGIGLCTGQYVLLLNNDVFVNPECLSGGLEYLRENNNVGIWAPKLVSDDDSMQVSCARLPSINGLIGEYLLFRNLDWYNDVYNWTEPHDVGNVVGAYLLLKKSGIKEIGPLDEDFFFSVEDVDYCKRVHEAGLSVVYDPRFTVLHIGSASSEDSWISSNYLHNHRVLYFRKHHGRLLALIAWMIINSGLIIRRIK